MKIRFWIQIDNIRHALEGELDEEDLIDKGLFERQVKQFSAIPSTVIRDALQAQRNKVLKKKCKK